MHDNTMFTVSDGLAVLGPDALRIIGFLERRIAIWASGCGARAYNFPPLLRVDDLSSIDYFANFPHLGSFAARIDEDALKSHYGNDEEVQAVPSDHLTSTEYALPSAACYNIYFHMKNSILDQPRYVTTLARCYRNEAEYKGMSRLWSFQMREIVCLGEADVVRDHLRSFRDQILAFAERIDLPLDIAVATDPFYDKSSSRARMQQLFPVKEEFVYGDGVAIASLNFHRNFFGERCQIKTDSGEAAFTACVAFGIERWLHALDHRYQGNADRIAQVLEAALR